MKKMTKYLLLPLLIILSVLFIFQHPFHTEKIGFYHENSIMKNIKIKKISKDSIQWVASIKEARFTGNEDTAYLKNISIYYPEKDFTLTSLNGVYNIEKGAINLDNSVRGFSHKLLFRTNRLQYNPEKGIISANKGVIIKGKRITITGNRARLKEKNKLEIEGNVKTIFK